MQAIIIGAGIGGLMTAIALQKVGIAAQIYEQAPEARAVGAGLTLWANAVRCLEQVGLDHVVQAAYMDGGGGIRRWDGQALSIIDTALVKARYHAPIIVVHRAEFLDALLHAAGHVVHYGKRLIRYENHGDSITAFFEDGTSAQADLLIGTDGIHSLVRQQMHPQVSPVYRGYAAWRGVVDFQHERVGNMWGEAWGRGARFGIVPLTRNRVYWFATANRPKNSPPAQHQSELLRLFGNWHQPIPQLIQQTAESAILYNDIADLETLPHWLDGRAVLLGDAAHAMTPNLGQGACQAIEDALTLAYTLNEAPRLEVALSQYEKLRLRHTQQVQVQSRRIGQMGQLENAILTNLRDKVMQWMPSELSLNALHPILAYQIGG